MGITKQYLRYVHSGTCNVVASTNGSIASVNSNVCAVSACENVNFYNLRTCEKVNELNESDKCVTTLKFSTNRRFLAVGYADGVIRLFDRKNEDGQVYATFAGHKTGVNCLAFSHDGLLLASGGKDSTIILWDIVNECGLFRLNGHKGSVTQLQFTLNGRYLISSSKDTFVKFWSLDSQSCFYTLTDSRSEVYTFGLVKEDSLLLLGTAEVEIRVIELVWLENEGGNDDRTIEAKRQKEEIDSKIIDVDDDLANGIVRCKKRGQLLRSCKGRALQMAISSDERIVACVGSSNVVDIYRIYSEDETLKRINKKLKKAKKRVAESDDVENSISESDISKDVTTLISRIGDYKSDVKVKSVDFCRSFSEVAPHCYEYPVNHNNYIDVTESFCHPEEVFRKLSAILSKLHIHKQMFILQSNNTVHRITATVDLKSNGIECGTISTLDQWTLQLGHRTDVRCLSMAENDFGFVSGSSELAIVWNRYNLKVVNVLEDEKMKDVTAVLFVPGDKHVLTGTKVSDFSVVIFMNSFRLLYIHSFILWFWNVLVECTHDPNIQKGFISCGADKKLIYWSYELVDEFDRKRLSMQEKRILELPDEAMSVAASNDSKFVGVALLDNTARIHFVDTFKLFVTLYGHSLPVTTIDMSSDSKLVITGSADKSVKIWGMDFGDCHRSLHAHDDIVTCVQFVPKEHLFWSSGKDGLLKQWDGDKFERIQVLSLHSAEIRSLTQTSNGNFIVSASHDRSIRVWELTEEIIVLQEEEEMERENEYEKRLTELEDVVPGEEKDSQVELASKKSVMSIRSAEQIIDAVEIARQEVIKKIEDPKGSVHPLMLALKSPSLDHFIIDVIQRVPSSHLEKCLLMVPFNYVPDILRALGECSSKHYKAELACRVLLFLIKIHHNHIINSEDMIHLIDDLRKNVPSAINELRDICGFNLAALRLFQKEIEERNQTKMFIDVSEMVSKSKKKVRKGVIKTLV
ncbi:unnamed protein product [Anisakis simplex]|uniref:WD_REPEATS_REGION domain-containing protein n=1 Tax=Anisakis simplex TaxID=6269 RepID=A0A0M3JZI3_ANISI|nr:unnamed protein product [Anisakis simplex]